MKPKKKIKINELAALLYIKTIDTEHIRNTLKTVFEGESINISAVLIEVIVLRLITVSYLLSSGKIFRSLKKKAVRLQMEYIEHFEADEDKYEREVPFVDLLEKRTKTYRPLLERDCIECALNLAEIFSSNCGVDASKAFVYLAKNCYLDCLLNFNTILHSYKITG